MKKQIWRFSIQAFSLFFVTLACLLIRPDNTWADIFTWTGSQSGQWYVKDNWNPNTSIPGINDTVIIDNNLINKPFIDQDIAVKSFVILDTEIHIDNAVLTVEGDALFDLSHIKGTGIIDINPNENNEDLANSCFIRKSKFDILLAVRAENLSLEESEFFNVVDFFCTNEGVVPSKGGNIFFKKVKIKKMYTGQMRMANEIGDVFKGDVLLEVSGGTIDIGYHGHTEFHGDIVLDGNTGSINFGQGSGGSTLAAGKKISISPSPTVRLRGFKQLGTTPQQLIFSMTGRVYLEEGTVFEGDIHLVCGRITMNGATFKGKAFIEMGYNSEGFNYKSGNNTFEKETVIINSGKSNMFLGFDMPDLYKEDVTFIRNGSGALNVAYGGGTHYFSHNIKVESNNGMPVHFGGDAGIIRLNGETTQYIQGNTVAHFSTLNADYTTEDDIILETALEISKKLRFTKRKIITGPVHQVIFLTGADYEGANNQSFVEGSITKYGNEAFTFPVGKAGFMRAVTISENDNPEASFTVEYFNEKIPDYLYEVKAPLTYLSECEYWKIQNQGDALNMSVSLNWNEAQCAVGDNYADLVVAKYDENVQGWVSEGQTDILFDGENPYVGSIVSNKTISSWGYFTIGTTNNTPLPVRLIDFTASLIGKEKALIQWTSLAGEGEVDHFIVEKSRDAENFVPVGHVKSADHPAGEVSYTVVDNKVYQGRSYYRLRQVDYDGTINLSKVILLNADYKEVSMYPNPLNAHVPLTIHLENTYADSAYVIISDKLGRTCLAQDYMITGGAITIQESAILKLKNGLYTVKVTGVDFSHQLKLVKAGD